MKLSRQSHALTSSEGMTTVMKGNSIVPMRSKVLQKDNSIPPKLSEVLPKGNSLWNHRNFLWNYNNSFENIYDSALLKNDSLR